MFAKAPIAGTVKSRLSRGIGAVRATSWYRRALVRTLRTAAAAGLPLRVSAFPCAHRFRAHSAVAARLSDQPGGDLGRRMAGVAQRAGGASLIVGCDIPDLTPAILRAGAAALRGHDLVLGPARDGGFYLVGLRTPAHASRLYRGVRWSSAFALADTLANVPKHWRVAFLPTLRDVDLPEDLDALGWRL